MQINSKSVVRWSIPRIIKALEKLPSGFSERTAQQTKPYFDVNSRLGGGACDQYNNMINTINSSKSCSDEKLYDLLMSSFHGRYGRHDPMKGWLLYKYVLCSEDKMTNHLGLSRKLLKKSVDIFSHTEYGINLYFASSLLYGVLGVALQQATQPEQKVLLQRERKQLGKKINQRRNQLHGEEASDDAYCVNQGEVGFSSYELIGSANVASCICFVVRDPATKKVALAHFDDVLSEVSTALKFIFDQYDQRAQLEVRLIGGRKSLKTSEKLRVDMLTELRNYNVNIISADLLLDDIPVSIVVDPLTFKMREAVPKKALSHKFITPSVLYRNRKVFFRFDLTQSRRIFPQLHTSVIQLGRREGSSAFDYFKEHATLHYYAGLLDKQLTYSRELLSDHINEVLANLGVKKESQKVKIKDTIEKS